MCARPYTSRPPGSRRASRDTELAALAETDAILQQVNSGKRVLLMSEILSSIQYPDLEVREDLRFGRMVETYRVVACLASAPAAAG